MQQHTYSYWHKQQIDKPLYPDIEWSRPEQKSLCGKLGIVGGNKLGLMAVSVAYEEADSLRAGAIRILLPDALQKSVPSAITDTLFASSSSSGTLGKDSLGDMLALGSWADHVLFVGDAGKSSETAIAYESFMRAHTGPITITRDAIDLVIHNMPDIVVRPETLVVASFSQLQKIFRSVYYPKVLTFSMHLAYVVEAVHKFTLSYPLCVVTFHKENLIIAYDGHVITTEFDNPMAIWRGILPTRMACYYMWNRGKVVEAVAASVASYK